MKTPPLVRLAVLTAALALAALPAFNLHAEDAVAEKPAAATPPAVEQPDAEVEVVGARETERLLKLQGTKIAVEGTIVRTGVDAKSGMNFLNFSSKKNHGFVSVVFARDLPNFKEGKPKDIYDGHNVRITGIVQIYNGQPQIVLASPFQITVLDEESKPAKP